jgi:hypothetical protein
VVTSSVRPGKRARAARPSSTASAVEPRRLGPVARDDHVDVVALEARDRPEHGVDTLLGHEAREGADDERPLGQLERRARRGPPRARAREMREIRAVPDHGAPSPGDLVQGVRDRERVVAHRDELVGERGAEPTKEHATPGLALRTVLGVHHAQADEPRGGHRVNLGQRVVRVHDLDPPRREEGGEASEEAEVDPAATLGDAHELDAPVDLFP